MKSRQFIVGLMLLILTSFFSLKTVAQCCVAPVNLTVKGFQFLGIPEAHMQWQRLQEAGCITPVKYKVQWRPVGQTFWFNSVVITEQGDEFGSINVSGPNCNGCLVTYEWRVRGICSDTDQTKFVNGTNFTLKGVERCPIPGCFPGFTSSLDSAISSASAASSQGKFTIAAYPNPVASELKLSGNLKAGGTVTIQIVNSVGQTVLREDHNFNSGDFSTDIDVSKLPPGVYLVLVNDDTEKAALSIIKQ
jgi:hypothetical protein